MRSLMFVCLLLWSVPTTASTILIEHDGATNPATEGWRVMSGVPGEAVPIADAWAIQTLGHGRWGPDTTSWYTDPASWFEDDWELSVTYEYGMGDVGQQRTTVFDGLHGWSTAFSWDEQHAYYYKPGYGKPFGGDTAMPDVNPWEPHTYTLAYDVGTGIADVSVDGELIDSMMPWELNQIAYGTYLLYWGDNQGEAGASSGLWYNVTFSQIGDSVAIPEPSSWLLALLAGLGLWGWRRLRS